MSGKGRKNFPNRGDYWYPGQKEQRGCSEKQPKSKTMMEKCQGGGSKARLGETVRSLNATWKGRASPQWGLSKKQMVSYMYIL